MAGFDRMDDLNQDGELITFEREMRDYNRYTELSGASSSETDFDWNSSTGRYNSGGRTTRTKSHMDTPLCGKDHSGRTWLIVGMAILETALIQIFPGAALALLVIVLVLWFCTR